MDEARRREEKFFDRENEIIDRENEMFDSIERHHRQEKRTLTPMYPTRRSTKAQMKPGLGPRASTSLPHSGAEA